MTETQDLRVHQQHPLTHEGYEIPSDFPNEAKDVVSILAEKKIVVFQHDDSLSLIIRDRLKDWAGDVGVRCIDLPYQIFLIDEDFYDDCVFDGTQLDISGKVLD